MAPRFFQPKGLGRASREGDKPEGKGKNKAKVGLIFCSSRRKSMQSAPSLDDDGIVGGEYKMFISGSSCSSPVGGTFLSSGKRAYAKEDASCRYSRRSIGVRSHSTDVSSIKCGESAGSPHQPGEDRWMASGGGGRVRRPRSVGGRDRKHSANLSSGRKWTEKATKDRGKPGRPFDSISENLAPPPPSNRPRKTIPRSVNEIDGNVSYRRRSDPCDIDEIDDGESEKLSEIDETEADEIKSHKSLAAVSTSTSSTDHSDSLADILDGDGFDREEGCSLPEGQRADRRPLGCLAAVTGVASTSVKTLLIDNHTKRGMDAITQSLRSMLSKKADGVNALPHLNEEDSDTSQKKEGHYDESFPAKECEIFPPSVDYISLIVPMGTRDYSYDAAESEEVGGDHLGGLLSWLGIERMVEECNPDLENSCGTTDTNREDINSLLVHTMGQARSEAGSR